MLATRRIFIHEGEITLFKMTEQFFTLFTDEAIVIFILNMDNEFVVVELSTLSHSFDVFKRDLALESMIFDICEI